MKIDKLKKLLMELTGHTDVAATVKSISHWTKRIKAEGKYTTRIHSEMETLERLGTLGIIKLELKGNGEAEAVLTKEGEELTKDFFMNGFYAQPI